MLTSNYEANEHEVDGEDVAGDGVAGLQGCSPLTLPRTVTTALRQVTSSQAHTVYCIKLL